MENLWKTHGNSSSPPHHIHAIHPIHPRDVVLCALDATGAQVLSSDLLSTDLKIHAVALARNGPNGLSPGGRPKGPSKNRPTIGQFGNTWWPPRGVHGEILIFGARSYPNHDLRHLHVHGAALALAVQHLDLDIKTFWLKMMDQFVLFHFFHAIFWMPYVI